MFSWGRSQGILHAETSWPGYAGMQPVFAISGKNKK